MQIQIKTKLTGVSKEIVDRLLDTRKRELELIADLTEEQLIGPPTHIV